MGRYDSYSSAGRQRSGDLAFDTAADPHRNLFYHPNPMSAIRLFPDMLKALVEKKGKDDKSSLSSFQTLIVSTATRIGMGNLVGVVAAVSAGGAGAVFWMWVTAIIGSSTAFIEATLAQLYKEKDPLYGGYRGGPA